MADKQFDPSEWLHDSPNNDKEDTPKPTPIIPLNNLAADIQSLVEQVEASGIDITSCYQNWLDIGFALVEALGEDGRDYFHRLSYFNADYDKAEADKQYTHCLHSRGSGITPRTLFHIAKQHGITVRNEPAPAIPPSSISPKYSKFPADNSEKMENLEDLSDVIAQVKLPTFSDKLKASLPLFLQEVMAKAKSDQDADMLLLGTLTVISACMPHVSGIYDEREFYPNLYLFVTAPASAGKGRMTLCRHIVQPIQDDMEAIYNAEMDQYNSQMADYVVNRNGGEEPQKPTRRTLFIPANSSSSKFYKTLNDNEGLGIMFETEGDNLTSTLKTDYGNYSAGFRNAFQHENISYNRVKDDALVEIKKPKLSVLLSGTPCQIQNLFHDAENGLFSRFLFYHLNVDLKWHVNFASKSKEPIDRYYKELGYKYYALYRMLESSRPILFGFTEGQGNHFNETFQVEQNSYLRELGMDMLASMRRLGLFTFRIAMVFSVLRIMEHGEIPEMIICEDEDFNSALYIAHVLAQHTSYILQGLPKSSSSNPVKQPALLKQNFLDALPDEFNRTTYQAIAKQLGIPVIGAVWDSRKVRMTA